MDGGGGGMIEFIYEQVGDLIGLVWVVVALGAFDGVWVFSTLLRDVARRWRRG